MHYYMHDRTCAGAALGGGGAEGSVCVCGGGACDVGG